MAELERVRHCRETLDALEARLVAELDRRLPGTRRLAQRAHGGGTVHGRRMRPTVIVTIPYDPVRRLLDFHGAHLVGHGAGGGGNGSMSGL